MRCATVGSGTRKARAISSVVSPPISRKVSATRASVESTGWQEVKMSRKQIVADVVVERRIEVGRVRLVHLAADLLVLALDQLGAAMLVERAVLRRRHQPGGGIVRNALFGPALERGDQRVLRELFGDADVARDARDAGDDLRLLDPPDRLDRLVRVGSHGSRLEQLACVSQARLRQLQAAEACCGTWAPQPGSSIISRSSISRSVKPCSAWICITRRAPAIASAWLA